MAPVMTVNDAVDDAATIVRLYAPPHQPDHARDEGGGVSQDVGCADDLKDLGELGGLGKGAKGDEGVVGDERTHDELDDEGRGHLATHAEWRLPDAEVPDRPFFQRLAHLLRLHRFAGAEIGEEMVAGLDAALADEDGGMKSLMQQSAQSHHL